MEQADLVEMRSVILNKSLLHVIVLFRSVFTAPSAETHETEKK